MNAERKDDRNQKEAKPEQNGWRKALRERFGRFAQVAAHAAGHPLAFVFAMLTIIVWAFAGPMFGFSDTWQLVINTGTTIVTFLMVFLIQNSQNRDGAAIQLKLDELIRAVSKARNEFVDLENVSEEELERIRERFARVAEKAKAKRDPGDPPKAEFDDEAEDEDEKAAERDAQLRETAASGS